MRPIVSMSVYLVLLLAVAAPAREITVKVVAADTRQPLAGATVNCWAGSEKRKSVTDANGVATFTDDFKSANFMRVAVTAAGRVGLRSFWHPKQPGERPQEKWDFALDPATRIGGRVVDETGKPLTGAHVVAEIPAGQDVDVNIVTLEKPDVLTDADGRWSIDGIPAVCKSIELVAFHYDCLTEDGYYNGVPFEPQASLRDATATLKLKRGTPIRGTVVDADGQPVKDAKVYYNVSRNVSNAIPALKTDADGAFTLGVPPNTTPKLVIEKKGYAPTMAMPAVESAPLPLRVTLPPPGKLAGRLVDASGRGVAGATVAINNWHGENTLSKRLTTDADGRFAWNEAPADGVGATIYGEGLAYMRDVPLKAGDANEVRVNPATPVTFEVVDAATGQPVKDFDTREGYVWNAGERMIWQSSSNTSEKPKASGTGWACTITDAIAGWALRVEADGYYPADTPTFKPDGTPKHFSIKLDRGKPLAGRATLADGKPAGAGRVYFATDYLSVSNGDQVRFAGANAPVAADGTFTLRPQREKGRLLIITENGVGRWDPGEFENRTEFKLQPWAKVSGRVMVGDKPMANTSFGASEFADAENLPPVVRYSYDVVTDSDGRFTLEKVWPGQVTLTQYGPNRAPRRGWNTNVGAFVARAGQNEKVQVGGSGRPVVGKLTMAFGKSPWMMRLCEAKSTTDPAAAELSPRIGDDGSFRIDDVPAGTYALTIALHEWPPDESCGWGRVLGEYRTTFTVPPVEGGGLGSAVDVGTLASTVVATKTVQAGDVAPDFTATTLDGKTAKLSDYKGKTVLLDFWATWCAPCVAEMPNLKKLHDAHRGNGDFVFIGMNADEHTKILKTYLAENGYDWPQALLGPNAATAEAYGATAIPMTVLIGPDGRVIARDLRGDALREAVERALRPAP